MSLTIDPNFRCDIIQVDDEAGKGYDTDSQLMVNRCFGFGAFGLLGSPKMQGIVKRNGHLDRRFSTGGCVNP